ncbi:hypothetical protein [Rufibacter psychrotolerans]|uniref:hypothetical protein n=1 Tax=Rufibacter psychrotolerans TaxID=2812556 RepID=UPI0019677344|nr:hypothetical protein [Rufibacter sp. SYSU D00308]
MLDFTAQADIGLVTLQRDMSLEFLPVPFENGQIILQLAAESARPEVIQGDKGGGGGEKYRDNIFYINNFIINIIKI